jgi:CBS domain-containing protein
MQRLVVVDADRVLGIITDRDITVRCAAESHDVSRCRVREHMSKGVISVEPDADILEAAHLMTQWQVKRLPVTKDGYLVGIVSFSDVANALDEPIHDLLIGMGAARRAA